MIDSAKAWAAFADKTVRMAGREVIELRNTSRVEAAYKEAGELVTSADLASAAVIQEAIARAYPHHKVLSEETAEGDWTLRNIEGPLWIVDPLDGTVNFSRGMPHFAVSMAFAIDGVVWAGAVHAPDLGLTYVGVRGGGAFCNGTPLQISQLRTLSHAVIGTGFPHDKSEVLPSLARVNRLLPHCRDIRRMAAPALDICYVASGQLDAHTESLAPWDLAAAGLIAREAGARIGHEGLVPSHLPPDLYGEGFVCAIPGLFEELLDLLRSP